MQQNIWKNWAKVYISIMSEEKKNMADKAKKAAVIAATGASVVVGSLYASPDELINPKPLTMMEPANNEGWRTECQTGFSWP